MDATRIEDGKLVSIKRVRRRSQEPSIALFLSPTEKKNGDPRNHCVPILDCFTDESLPNLTFLVMPLVRRFDNPPFFAVDEVLDFMRQTLEVCLSHLSGHVAYNTPRAYRICIAAVSRTGVLAVTKLFCIDAEASSGIALC